MYAFHLRPIFLAAVLALVPLLPRVAVGQGVPADTLPEPVAGRVSGGEVRSVVPDSVPEPEISARGAFFRSLVLPGWGQSRLGAPVRGGVYFALEAGSLWMVYKSQQKLEEAREAQRILRATGALATTAETPLVRDREAQREDWITLAVFWAFFAGADAFVAWHLQDFDAQVGVRPAPGGDLELRYSIPVGPR